MKEFFKAGFSIYVGYQIAKVIDRGFNISDKLINVLNKIKITKEQ